MKRSPLVRRPPGKRAEAGRVTPEQASATMHRDGGCVAVLLDPDLDMCHDRYGHAVDRLLADLTIDHVHEEGKASMGKKGSLLITLCRHHGVQSWELTHRRIIRRYLRAIETEKDPVRAAKLARDWDAFA